MLLVPVQKSLHISVLLPRKLGAESGPNFALDSLRQMSRSTCRGGLFMYVMDVDHTALTRMEHV